MVRLLAASFALLSCSACTGGVSVADTDTDAAAGDWILSTHPCVGVRTDTLWMDDASTAWVGCGTAAIGTGLYRTDDGGQTWEVPTTTPAGFFPTFRVMDVSRSEDGLLYVAGASAASPDRVVSVDTAETPMELESVLSAGAFTFTVGTFRRASDGAAVAESSTGTDLLYRAQDEEDWEVRGDWATDAGGYQLLDLEHHDGGFFGCGSSISEPPLVFLPDRDETATAFQLEPVPLSATFDGELYGIDVDEGGIAVAGIDQDQDVGVAFFASETTGDAIYEEGGWSRFDVSTVVSGPTWLRGVCREASRILLVGENPAQGTGLVLESADDGATFEDVTPDGAPPLQECVLLSDGTAAVAGANGFFARRD